MLGLCTRAFINYHFAERTAHPLFELSLVDQRHACRKTEIIDEIIIHRAKPNSICPNTIQTVAGAPAALIDGMLLATGGEQCGRKITFSKRHP
jgi:hypothetical protein